MYCLKERSNEYRLTRRDSTYTFPAAPPGPASTRQLPRSTRSPAKLGKKHKINNSSSLRVRKERGKEAEDEDDVSDDDEETEERFRSFNVTDRIGDLPGRPRDARCSRLR